MVPLTSADGGDGRTPPVEPTEGLIAFLGPTGTFTQQAARTWAGDDRLVPCDGVGEVYAGIAAGRYRHGVVPIENSVEGYVVPSLDGIVEAADVVAIDEATVDVSFHALVLPDDPGPASLVTSHPHALAQCSAFVRELGGRSAAARSTAAACRDLQPGQVALAPGIAAELYGLRVLRAGVEDFSGARTRFLLLARREEALTRARARAAAVAGPDVVGGDAGGGSDADGPAGSSSDVPRWRSMLAVTPHVIGPGVLARITRAFGDRGVNMSSLITRPLKAQESKYVFVITVDSAPWQSELRAVLGDLLAAGDSLKTLGVFPARGEIDRVLDSGHVPTGSVTSSDDADRRDRGLLWG